MTRPGKRVGDAQRLEAPGLDYECTQTFPITVPGCASGGPLAGRTLQFVASLVSREPRSSGSSKATRSCSSYLSFPQEVPQMSNGPGQEARSRRAFEELSVSPHIPIPRTAAP